MAVMVISTSLFSNASASETPAEQWFAPYDRTRGDVVGFNFSEGTEFSRQSTYLAPNYPWGGPVNDGKSPYAAVCNGVLDARCSEAISFIYHAIFPVCDSTRVIDCIDSVWAEIAGKRSEGIFQESLPAKPKTPYEDNGATNLITGSTPSIWKIPGAIHGGNSDLYSVNTLIAQGSDPGARFRNFNTGGKLSLGISPVTLVKGNYPGLTAGQPWPVSADEYRVCATHGDNRCALKQAFPKETRFGISVRMSQPPLGWLHGRVKSPIASIDQIASGVKLSIEGEPVVTPAVAGNFLLSEYPESVQNSHKNENGKIIMMQKGGTIGGYGLNPGVKGANVVVYEPTLGGTTSALRLLLPLVKDKSAAEPTLWKISTLPYFDDNKIGQCVKNSGKLAGIVSTNSTTYSEGPPVLDQSTQSLDYELASAHYTSKGEEFLGSYDLVLDSSVARCIYGFNKTPTSATVSIVKDGAVEKVSTTTLTEKNGWLSLSAYGFTFSSPKISVKLNQPVEALPTPVVKVDSPTPTIKKPTTKTIYCVRGTSKKTIKGASPSCPKGYKVIK